MKKNITNPEIEIERLAESIKEGSKTTLKTMLNEAVSEFLREEVLNEEDDDETTDVNTKDEIETSDIEETDEISDDAENAEETSEEAEEDSTESETDEDEWADFEDYKIADEDGSEEYDFTNETNPEQIVKIFKLMKNNDQVSVVKDGEKVSIKDNEAGTEYVIELDCETSNNNDETNCEFTMAESLGYTDNYQDKDPIEGLSMDDAPKNTKDWHKGVPTGTEKPWASKGNNKPFGEKTEKVFEITLNDNVVDCNDEIEFDDEFEFDNGIEFDDPIEEATNVGGFVQQNSTSKSHVPNSNGRKARNMSKDGEKKTGTADPRYSGVNESLKLKVEKALQENKQLKETITKVSKIMKEAVQVNVNLGHIVRLMVENTTSKQEKEDIIRRFNSVKSNEEAKNLFESISSELRKSRSTIVTEQATTAQGSNKINEAKIYEEPNGVLSMMKRMNMI